VIVLSGSEGNGYGYLSQLDVKFCLGI